MTGSQEAEDAKKVWALGATLTGEYARIKISTRNIGDLGAVFLAVLFSITMGFSFERSELNSDLVCSGGGCSEAGGGESEKR